MAQFYVCPFVLLSKRENNQSEKPARRVRGEGSVFQRPDGRWVASIPLQNKKRRVEYYDDRKQAERARRRMLKELKVGRSLSYIQDPDTGHHEFVLDAPKTASSRRVLHLPQFILDSLMEHRRLQQRKQSRDREWQKLDLVFCSETGSYLHPNNLSEDFDRLLKETGLPDIRFHDLRHSAATIWIALGVN